MASVRQLREASSAGGSVDTGGAVEGRRQSFSLRRGDAACRSCGQQENQWLAHLCDLVAFGIEKADSSTSLSARSCWNQSLCPYLTPASCLNIQIPFKIPKQRLM